MATLSREQLAALAQAVARTRDEEIACDDVGVHLAAFLERGPLTPERRAAIEAHLAICPECTEELRLLAKTIEPA